jgi:hypothetical protein
MLALSMMRRGITLLSLIAFAIPAAAHSQVAQPSMIGRWQGNADVVASWTKQRTLTADITVFADDRVTGSIGDAKLVDGRIRKNRGWFATRMSWKTDYVIDARLEGPIIRAENIERAAVRMPLNWTKGRFEGGINTSGSSTGGVETMALAANNLVLHRVPDMMICQLPTPCVP